jgi:choline kinase
MGVRLRPLTDSMPKAMVVCAGWPMLAYAVEFARRVVGPGGRLVVVGGFGGDRVRDWCEAEAPEARYVLNADYTKGNLLSVAAGLPAVEGGFLLMNVDHIYPFAFADRLASAPGDVVAATDFDRTLLADDMKVKLDASRRVAGISKQLADFDCGYIGMTLVRDAAAAAYRHAFAATREKRGDAAVAENVLQELADRGSPASIADLSGLKWLEVDNLDDLAAAEEVLMTDPGLLRRGFGEPA